MLILTRRIGESIIIGDDVTVSVLGEVFVTAALCTHGGAPLCDGYLDGYIIECPLHQGCFDIRDGKALDAPVIRPLQTYPARKVAGMIQVKLP